MIKIKKLIPVLSFFCIITSGIARAQVLEVVAGVESGRFIDGVNLTGNEITSHLSADWSLSNGVFSSLSCFLGENGNARVVQRGCDLSAGWFVPISDSQAMTMEVSRHDYSSPTFRGWQYTDASFQWHINKNYGVGLKLGDSLLGQGFKSATLSIQASKEVNNHWRMNFNAGVTSLNNSADISTLQYGILSAEYGRDRWVSELKLMLSSSSYSRLVNLDIEQPEIAVNIRYRIY